MRLSRAFYMRDALEVAPELLGKMLVRQFEDGTKVRFPITDVEAYCGEEDLACHASKGRTKRTEVMYWKGGFVYVYMIYGMYWLLNIVTGEKDHPQAVLIRGLGGISGPGKVGRLLHLDKTFYGEDLVVSERIWLEDGPEPSSILSTPRIGIAYAGEWADKPWRFTIVL